MSRPAHNILGSLPVPKLVWTMSAPIMLSMLMSAIYNLVDSIYVAQVSELDLSLIHIFPPNVVAAGSPCRVLRPIHPGGTEEP